MKYCKVNGCNEIYYCKGFCRFHYRRNKNGTPLDLPKYNSKNLADYKNHHIMKKNRKIVLEKYPVCQSCNIKPATEVHHIDESKDNHAIENLLAVCRKCNANLRSNRKNKSKYSEKYGKLLKELCLEYGLSGQTIKNNIKNNRPLNYIRNGLFIKLN